MTPEKARELIAKVAKITEKVFRECGGGIDPVFHFEGDHGFTSMLCPGEYTPEVKDAASFVIRRILQTDNAKWVMMVSEAWFVNSKEEIEGSLEFYPGRLEVIYYRLEDEDILGLEARQEIHRPDGQQPYLGPLNIYECKNSDGRFVGLLPTKGKLS